MVEHAKKTVYDNIKLIHKQHAELIGYRADAMRWRWLMGDASGKKTYAEIACRWATADHEYYGAGDPACPQSIKAPNGELHTLMCKLCGEKNPLTELCLAKVDRAIASAKGDASA